MDTPERQVLIVPENVNVEALAAFVGGTGPLPEGARWEDEATFLARGRVADCTCKMISCVCDQVRWHRPTCRLRKSLLCPVAIECEHGKDVCPTCDACSCMWASDVAESLHLMTIQDRTLKGSKKL